VDFQPLLLHIAMMQSRICVKLFYVRVDGFERSLSCFARNDVRQGCQKKGIENPKKMKNDFFSRL
jgi:hypothetical protein